MAVPNTFANATTSIPLSQLDQNFATAITLGNTAIQLGNTVTTLNNMTLANVTVSSGNVTVTSLSGAFNGTVGATTPNTGAFTTGAFSSAVGLCGGAVPASTYAAAAANQKYIAWYDAGTSGGTSAYIRGNGGVLEFAGSSMSFANGASVSTFSSTGLAVTGTLSATGIVTAGGTDGFKTSADNLGLYFNGSRNAVIGSNASDTVTIGAANATRGVFSSTGLAVTGTLTTTGSSGQGLGLANATRIEFKDSGGTYRDVMQLFSDNNLYISAASGNMVFRYNNGASTGMTLDSSGNLLVGTTNASTYSVFTAASRNATTNTDWRFGPSTDSRTTSVFWVQDASNAGVYLTSGNTSWTANSDERLKDILEPITNAAEKVSTLRAVIGKYKTDDEGKRRPFLIAQDVQAVLPEAISTSKLVGSEDETEYLGIQYTDTIPLLVAAIKELNAKVAALEAKNAPL